MATKRKKKNGAARKTARKPARKRAAAPRRKKSKSVFLRNFTGTVSQLADKRVSIVGRGRKGRGK